ncbi:hypothetical protein H4R33_005338 [Dimargaris cristalligena]|nr:hypothetical protein H4R33_005338 [Dimargaris cristalligena]
MLTIRILSFALFAPFILALSVPTPTTNSPSYTEDTRRAALNRRSPLPGGKIRRIMHNVQNVQQYNIKITPKDKKYHVDFQKPTGEKVDFTITEAQITQFENLGYILLKRFLV